MLDAGDPKSQSLTPDQRIPACPGVPGDPAASPAPGTARQGLQVRSTVLPQLGTRVCPSTLPLPSAPQDDGICIKGYANSSRETRNWSKM